MTSETTWLAHWSCGGPGPHVSSDTWEALSGRTGTLGVTHLSVSFGLSFAYDFPFTCLYINVQTLDSETAGESALWPCYWQPKRMCETGSPEDLQTQRALVPELAWPFHLL